MKFLVISVVICSSCCIAIGTEVKPYHGQDESIQGAYNYSQYQPFEKITTELRRIAELNDTRFRKSLFSLGKTFEGRELWALKIQDKNNSQQRKIIFVDCGAHAREWIAPATCMYLIKEFTTGENGQPNNLTDVIRSYDWVFVPLLNPDGYVYTWENKSTRLWRKNRSYTPEQIKLRNERDDEQCIGVDINRNFDKSWGGPGAPVSNPCYEMYAGSHPFSENEATALANFLNQTKDDLIAYISLHSFGQAWMTPWGYTKKLPRVYAEQVRVAKLAVSAMKNLSGVQYDIGPSHDTLYPNSGSSTDWAYSKLNITYSYVIEMMPKYSTDASFLLPPHMMVKNTRDVLEGLRVMATALTKEFRS